MVQFPTYTRKQLFQTTARLLDNRTWVGTTAGSIGAAGTVYFLDARTANTAFSGERLYDRAWVWDHGTQQAFRVASFNTASGAFITVQTAASPLASGGDFTVIPRLSPYDLNLSIDRTVSRMRGRQEVVIQATDQAHYYTIDTAASGASVQKVLNVYYFAQATATTDRDIRYFWWWGVQTTGSGTTELRIDPSVASGAQIVLDAIVDMTLGAAETATINLPHDEWLHSGALMHAYNLLVQQAPGQASGELRQNRAEWANQWRVANAKYQPLVDRSMAGMFDENPFNKGRGR